MESFLTHAGYLALIIFAFVEACSIPISSEITFGFAGVLAAAGHLNLALVIIIGTMAELAGSCFSYGVGRMAGRDRIERMGGRLLLTRADLDRAERFFGGRGAWSVAVARVIPVIRAFTGLVAGLLEIPAGPFVVFNLIGTAVWATALSLIGYTVGSAWSRYINDLSLVGYVAALVAVLGIVFMFWHRLRQVRKEQAALRSEQVPVASNGRGRHRQG